MERSQRFWNPYVAGVALGLVMLTSFLILGKGLGASGAANRLGVAAVNLVAPEHVAENAYMARSVNNGHPLDYPLAFLVLGVFLGGLIAAYTAGRLRPRAARGP